MKYKPPFLLYFPSVGSADIGFISIAEFERQMPFRAERIFWTYDTPPKVVRGHHAHKTTEQVLVAVSGKITVRTETAGGDVQTFVLAQPNVGLYLPPHVWHTMRYSKNAVQLALASTPYHESDYFREKDAFKEYWLNL